VARRETTTSDAPKRRFGRKPKGDPSVDAPPGRIAAIRQAYTFTVKVDSKLPLILLGAFFIPFLVLLGVGFAVGHAVVLGILGFAVGFLVMTTLFTRRSQKAQYDSVEGQPGVAAAIAERVRSNPLRVTPAVQLNRDQAMVHRALGRAGVVLLAEGRTSGPLIANETRRLAKVLGDTPITVITVGNGEGEVPLGKLQAKLMRLPRTLRPASRSACGPSPAPAAVAACRSPRARCRPECRAARSAN
jgi:uncharacterized membrane protein (DUF485 family)